MGSGKGCPAKAEEPSSITEEEKDANGCQYKGNRTLPSQGDKTLFNRKP